MKHRNRGLAMGAFLLFFFAIYLLRDYIYFNIVENSQVLIAQVIGYIPKIIVIIFIFFIAKVVVSIMESILEKYFKIIGQQREYLPVRTITKYVIWFIAILGMLSVFIGNVAVWMTSVGLIGFGITFALQKPILNFVGWLTVMFSKPYQIGDRIEVGSERGDIIDIRLMYTIMDGLIPNTDELSGKIITFPNELALTGSIVNFTKSGEYVWDGLTISVTYESNWQKASEMVKAIASEVCLKYVKPSNQKSEKADNLLELINLLKKHKKESENPTEQHLLDRKITEVKEETRKITDARIVATKDARKEVLVRVELNNSSVDLHIRYLAHYRKIKTMRSEINSQFLTKIMKDKSIHVAYPHLQLVK